MHIKFSMFHLLYSLQRKEDRKWAKTQQKKRSGDWLENKICWNYSENVKKKKKDWEATHSSDKRRREPFCSLSNSVRV